jgi:predicted nucleic acid-binding Zn finger protein
MNIFAINNCPSQSAKELCNKHIIKMPLETLGMLVFAFEEGKTLYPNNRKNRHYLHPASIWARSSKNNFEWLLEHGFSLCSEYQIRYKREHFACSHLLDIKKNINNLIFEQVNLTPFSRCFSSFKEELDKTTTNTIEAYKLFYKKDKKDFAKWPSLEKIPSWWDFEQKQSFVDKSFKNGLYTKR